MGGNLRTSGHPSLAPFVNPALLTPAARVQTSFSQAKLSADTLTFQVAAGVPVGVPGLGLGLGWGAVVARDQIQREYVLDAEGRFVPDPVTGLPTTRLIGFFTRNDNTIFLSVDGKAGLLSLGASFKGLLTQFGGLRGQGWGFDAGFLLSPHERLALGGTLTDLGDTRLDFPGDDLDETLPSAVRVSAGWKFLEPGDFVLYAEPGVERVLGAGERVRWSAGLEVVYRGQLSLRAGSNRDRLSFGVGFATPLEKVLRAVRVDYAFLARGNGGYPSRLTLTVDW